jgi:hypothetical protein
MLARTDKRQFRNASIMVDRYDRVTFTGPPMFMLVEATSAIRQPFAKCCAFH